MNARLLFERLLRVYKKAWETRDPTLAMKLFTGNATYQEDPFDPRPMKGLNEIYAYWAKVPLFQKNIRFTHRPVFQLGRSRVWGAEWLATYTKVKTGERVQLRGVLFSELSNGKIRRFWEYWHVKGGKPAFRATRQRRRRAH